MLLLFMSEVALCLHTSAVEEAHKKLYHLDAVQCPGGHRHIIYLKLLAPLWFSSDSCSDIHQINSFFLLQIIY